MTPRSKCLCVNEGRAANWTCHYRKTQSLNESWWLMCGSTAALTLSSNQGGCFVRLCVVWTLGLQKAMEAEASDGKCESSRSWKLPGGLCLSSGPASVSCSISLRPWAGTRWLRNLFDVRLPPCVHVPSGEHEEWRQRWRLRVSLHRHRVLLRVWRMWCDTSVVCSSW